MEKDIKIKIMKITTPIEFDEDEKNIAHVGDFFDFNRFNYCIKEKMNLSEKERLKTYKETESFYIENYNEDFSEDFAVGNFISLKHGFISDNLNITEFKVTRQNEKDDAIKNKVSFLIDKKSGYFYIVNDELYVINIEKLRHYFFIKKPKRMKYIKKFNEKNPNAFIDENNNKLYMIELLEPLPFLEKISKLKTVKNIKIKPSKTIIEDEKDNNIFDELKQNLDKNKVGEYQTEIKLTKFKNNKLTDELKNFIEYLAKSQKYEDIAVEGNVSNNYSKKITEDSTTRDFYVKNEVDVKGFPKEQQLFQNIQRVIEEEEQLNVDNSQYRDIKGVELETEC
ncbi:hypothetical protein PXW92_07580 [Staphylococcus hominis]|uniref:hypothetical protein n=1 Tax=Staphylococcus hominis TaxID=1290 RepID=UPI0007654779|nr:hypothetical protein [Staphylococcus hominis]MDS0981240.1 hypothetical protein [Staphylococcus hominis]CVY54502.1 Uncharacterised protein [Staphylococcus hominis]